MKLNAVICVLVVGLFAAGAFACMGNVSAEVIDIKLHGATLSICTDYGYPQPVNNSIKTMEELPGFSSAIAFKYGSNMRERMNLSKLNSLVSYRINNGTITYFGGTMHFHENDVGFPPGQEYEYRTNYFDAVLVAGDYLEMTFPWGISGLTSYNDTEYVPGQSLITYCKIRDAPLTNPQISNYVGWTSPASNANYTNPETFDITCNGTGTDMDTVTLNVDMWWYWQSNHTRTHFYNSSSDIVVTATTWTFDESDWEMPTVTASKVCRLVYRVQAFDMSFLLTVPDRPGILYNTVWGISDPFTINPIVPPAVTDNGITITVTSAGVNGKSDIGDTITIEAIIQCDLGITGARVLYKPVGSDSWTSVVMELVAGDDESGTWEGVIPAQDAAGFVYYKVTATSTEGLDATTSQAAVQVMAEAATPTPAGFSWDFTTLQWAGIAAMAIGILALLGLLFTRRLAFGSGGIVLVVLGIGILLFYVL